MTQARATSPNDGIAARRAALHLIEQATGAQRLLSESIAAGALERLSPPDRARAQRLATQVLRQLPRADRALKPFLVKQPPLAVRNALRLGAVEIMEGAAAHGVVNAMVQIMSKGKRTQSYKGLVNAVLRKIGEQPGEAWAKLPAPKLPNWLRGPLVEAWGRKPVEAMEAVQAQLPPLDLTAKGDAAALAATLGGELLPTGSVRLREAGQVSALPGFAAGDWWVQDAAAAVAARVLDARPGERVLDLCAAPGGKTMQLAATGADVTALDLSEARLARLRENLDRTGLAARVVQADALEFDETGFDAILLDAPCSATGTIRRHPDLPHAKDGSEFGALIALQAEMIDHALGLLKPGGRLVFCTCSLLPDEGEVQVEEALARHPGLVNDREVLARPGIAPDWIGPEGLRLRPDFWAERGGMDGFFIACLRPGARDG
ncbi:16S rRNA (cytosine967-C5)-methyltransferase [Limimaricola soesokkakensis]|uniref:16S rRNA (Cytosine967-C5)-methyltransferase n=1 Tax=Limimaricola soesokkakensis TaxID=1343159 RepID=A0A1X6YKB4_9RHOB|nr:transcription antitermination factor NusB [Limimaricola soesokkakensis]PSK88564.1 16S rRNA (cytosine967-C5)-methyltransferase [Limimaricola soesokkakensis]SLN23077.1 Ribosomal RNA small subunit methyltransferase B [Limimaricola soesokkakensis]